MLNSLRRGSKSIFAKLLIALLVFAFAIWGIADFANQIDPTEVARAGDTPVSAREFTRIYERATQDMGQRVGRGLTPQEAASLGLPNQVLQALLTDAFQVDAAHALGLDLGDEALAERIRNDEFFADSSGNFDRTRFNFMLQDNRYSEEEFIELERDEAAREMLVNALVGGLSAPEPMLRAFNRFRAQSRRIAYITLTEEELPPLEEPTEAELRTYFEENTEAFRAPEYRAISVVTLTAEAIADPSAVLQSAVEEAYNRDGAYGEPARRRVQQVVLSDRTAAEEAAAELNDGAALETVLERLERSMADVDLGLVTRDELVDPAVAEAAFSLEEGGAAAVDGRFGPVVVHVSEVDEGGKRPLSEVEDEIRADLAERDAARELRGLSNTVEDEFAGGATVAEVARRFGLPTREVTVDARGRDQNDASVDLGPADGAVVTAFDMEVEDDPIRVRGADERVWVAVNEVIPAADRSFEEVRDEVAAALRADRQENRLAERAEEALAAINAGESVEAVAERLGVSATTSAEFSRANQPQELAASVSAAAFEGGLGHTGSVVVGGDHIVFEVTAVNEPVFYEGDADVRPIAQSLNEGVANTLLFGVVNAWQAEVGASVNDPVFLGVTGQSDDPRFRR